MTQYEYDNLQARSKRLEEVETDVERIKAEVDHMRMEYTYLFDRAARVQEADSLLEAVDALRKQYEAMLACPGLPIPAELRNAIERLWA